MSMEDYVKDFDREFDNMSVGENLYAEAMAHLLDKDTNEFVESLGDEGCASMNAAADGGGSYE